MTTCKKTTAKAGRKAGSTRTDARAVPCGAGTIQGKRKKPYRVGYGRPPLEYRFKPGQSGNPHGRPKSPVKGGGRLYRLAMLAFADKPRRLGHGKPRKEYQFQAGQSGNPGGGARRRETP